MAINFVTINHGGYAPHATVTAVVHRLFNQHYSGEVSHYCFTDTTQGLPAYIEPIVLDEFQPGWFSKIELYGPNMPEGRFVYLDLDVLVLSDVTELIDGYDGVFCGDEDHIHYGKNLFSNHPQYGRVDCSLGTALVMGEAHAIPEVYEKYHANAKQHIKAFNQHGDQVFTSWALGGKFDLLERLYPKTHGFYSYKFNVLGNAPPNVVNKAKVSPSQCKWVNFHGKPKWWELGSVHQWINEAIIPY